MCAEIACVFVRILVRFLRHACIWSNHGCTHMPDPCVSILLFLMITLKVYDGQVGLFGTNFQWFVGTSCNETASVCSTGLRVEQHWSSMMMERSGILRMIRCGHGHTKALVDVGRMQIYSSLTYRGGMRPPSHSGMSKGMESWKLLFPVQ